MSFDLTIDFDFDAFEAEVYTAARNVFLKLQQEYSNETFYTFNLVTGNILQYVNVFVSTEEELTRNAADELKTRIYFGDRMPSLEDRKCHLRHSPHNTKFDFGETGKEIKKSFSSATAMLQALRAQLDDMEERLIDDEGMDEEDYYNLLWDTIHVPIDMALTRVMKRLDGEGILEATNTRGNIHLGVLSSADLGELMGPFSYLNPPEACAKYAEDLAAYQRVCKKLDAL